jgi:hypothetical protein
MFTPQLSWCPVYANRLDVRVARLYLWSNFLNSTWNLQVRLVSSLRFRTASQAEPPLESLSNNAIAVATKVPLCIISTSRNIQNPRTIQTILPATAATLK